MRRLHSPPLLHGAFSLPLPAGCGRGSSASTPADVNPVDTADHPLGSGPRGDASRTYDLARCVRDAHSRSGSFTYRPGWSLSRR